MEIYENIIQKAWNDETFKHELMTNPKSALAAFGQEFDDGVTVEVHDDSLSSMHFVLLDPEQIQGFALSDDPFGRITKRAHEDAYFRARLLESPKETVQELLGAIPPGNISIHENTPTHLHLVLPSNPDVYGELSDADLAVVAGGKGTYAKACEGVGTIIETVGKAIPGLGPLLTGGVSIIEMVSKIF